ncbi:MAG TPA: histidine kinase [Pyrinomonadaceae bacterium]|jgi:signal transduction histidine kinase
MSGLNIASLINLLGYTVGIALYAMLLFMVLKHPTQSTTADALPHTTFYAGWASSGLLLVTAVLGLLWNIGALAIYGLKGIGYSTSYPIVSAISFTALGFLPAVVVHSVLRGRKASSQQISKLIAIAAYSLSGVAGAFQLYEAVGLGISPSLWALRLLTFGYVALLVVLFISTHRQEGWKKAIWASALAVFAVSALHLSHHSGGNTDSWYVELTGHHASLPLVLAILYEDYRFAFADIFLKRAFAFFILVALACTLYIAVASPILIARSPGSQFDPRSVAILLGLWVVTALLYPWLSRGVGRFVDRVILQRMDYGKLRGEVAQILVKHETPDEILDELCKVLEPAVSAHQVQWSEIDSDENSTAAISIEESNVIDKPVGLAEQYSPVRYSRTDVDVLEGSYVSLLEGSGSKGALVFVPTAEPPYYKLEIGVLGGGRRLLSDDIAMLEAVAVMTARRIDALRVTHERCEQDLREQEINKLATEAQLRALRAQVNPHFLFNALTTIGYLVQTAPDRALETLMKLTSLLRSVLRTDNEFVTLDQELQLIAAYLDIERARFEERLRVSIDVPEDVLSVRIPSLLLQPLVENAIKHGITPSRFGGEVCIRARLESTSDNESPMGDMLNITVSDSGMGASEIDLARGRRRGLGLSNIEERLRWFAGQEASLRINSTVGTGTVVEVRLPMSAATSKGSVGSLRSARERRGA